MFLYKPDQITDILLVRDGRISQRPAPQQTLLKTFNDLILKPGSSNKAAQHPRALSVAIKELEGLGFSNEEIPHLVYPVLEATAKNFKENLKIEWQDLPRLWGKDSDITRIVFPKYENFLGVDFRFMLYTQDVTKKVSFDKNALEKMVLNDVFNAMRALHEREPALFDKKPPPDLLSEMQLN